MTKKGMLITFEGGEGAGKTTHAELFKNYLTQKGLSFFATREPGGTDFSEAVRALTKDMRFQDKSSLSELFLFEAARADIVEKRIIPALKEGKIVIMDRFYDSTTVYQSFGRGLNRADVENFNKVASQGLVPDLTIYLKVPQQDAFARKGGADKNDAIEQSGADFHERIRKGFDILAKENPDRFLVVDSSLPIAEVFKQITTAFEQKYNEKNSKKGKNCEREFTKF